MPILQRPFTIAYEGQLPKPYLGVTLTNPHTGRHRNVWALIDTGASDCAIPASLALDLGHDLQRGKEKKVSTGNGITAAYAHTLQIGLNGFNTGDILVDFLPNLKIPLLGVRSFLAHFVLTVNYPENWFSLLHHAESTQ